MEPVAPRPPPVAPEVVKPKVEGFLVRTLLLPVLPRLWSAARSMRVGQILGPLVLLSLLVHFGFGLIRGIGARAWILRSAREYDAHYDPVSIEGGEVRVKGPRLVHVVTNRYTLLVDPEETVSLENIITPEYVVVRRDRILQKRTFGPPREVSVAAVSSMLGRDRLSIDGSSLRAFASRFGPIVVVGLTVLMGVFGFLGDLFLVPLYALIAGALLHALRGRARGDTLGPWFRVALAASSFSVVVDVLADLAGVSVSFLPGLLLWPATAVVLGLLATGASRPTAAPSAPAP